MFFNDLLGLIVINVFNKQTDRESSDVSLTFLFHFSSFFEFKKSFLVSNQSSFSLDFLLLPF